MATAPAELGVLVNACTEEYTYGHAVVAIWPADCEYAKMVGACEADV
jgi:hypothetical protein